MTHFGSFLGIAKKFTFFIFKKGEERTINHVITTTNVVYFSWHIITNKSLRHSSLFQSFKETQNQRSSLSYVTAWDRYDEQPSPNSQENCCYVSDIYYILKITYTGCHFVNLWRHGATRNLGTCYSLYVFLYICSRKNVKQCWQH